MVEWSERACKEVLQKNLKSILVEVDNYNLRVGIPADARNSKERAKVKGKYKIVKKSIDEAVPIAEYAAKNEFGSFSEFIPPRPFMRTTFTQNNHMELIRKVTQQELTEVAKNNGDVKKALDKIGLYIASRVQKNIVDGNFSPNPPNAPVTIARKRSSKQLIDTGEMRRALTAWVVRKENV